MAELTAAEKLVKGIVASYGGLSKNTPCSYGAISDDGKHVRASLLEVCHRDLAYYPANVYDQLITSFPADCEADVAFFDFMKNVLYSKYSDHLLLEKTDKGKYYIRIINLSSISANVVFNICICSRAIVEYPGRLKQWRSFIVEGLPSALAFALCRVSATPKGAYEYGDRTGKCTLDTTIKSPGVDSGHWCMDITSNLKSIVNGPNGGLRMFKDSPRSVTPTNMIWGDTQHLRGLSGSTVREFFNKWKTELYPHEDLL